MYNMISLYSLNNTQLAENYKKIYLKAEESNNIKKCILGVEKNFRINSRESFFIDISDTDIMLKYCLYPLYFDGYTNVAKHISVLLQSMAESNHPLEVFQVYNFIDSQDRVIKNYSDIPFLIDFSQILKILIEKKEDTKVLLENYHSPIFNNYGVSLWKIVDNICNNSPTVQQYLNDN